MITFIDLYNDITGQAWSMFDGEVEDKDEFETTVTTSIQKALTTLWCSHKFPFRYKTQTIKTRAGQNTYNLPNGNITTKVIDHKKVYSVKCDLNFLNFDPSYEIKEDEGGEPEGFYVNNDKMVIYPTPDDTYTIKVDYLSIFPALTEDREQIGTLTEDTDYIDIPEKYEILFKNTLLPLAMVYLIASEQDENYSAYWKQYQLALNLLLEYTRGVEFDKSIGWRD